MAAATPRGSEGRAPPGPCGPLVSMGRTRKANVCRRLSCRALGFYARDAGVVQRTNLGILRALVCQVTPAEVGVPGVQPPAGLQFFTRSDTPLRVLRGEGHPCPAIRVLENRYSGPPPGVVFKKLLLPSCKQSIQNLGIQLNRHLWAEGEKKKKKGETMYFKTVDFNYPPKMVP